MPSPQKFFAEQVGDIEPIAVTVDQTQRLTGESRSKIYELLGAGVYQGVKAGSRTLIVYQSIKDQFANLPKANIKTLPPRRHPRAQNNMK